MTILGHRHDGRHFQKKPALRKRAGALLMALLLCFSMLTGFLSVPAVAADGEKMLSEIVVFQSIKLHYAGDGDSVGEEVKENALLEQGRRLVLRYEYNINEEQCQKIEANVRYYLEVSPHLELPHLESGKPLEIEIENGGKETFGWLYADGSRAWVVFAAEMGDSETTEEFETTESSETTEGSEITEESEITEGSETTEELEITKGFETAEESEITEGSESTAGSDNVEETVTMEGSVAAGGSVTTVLSKYGCLENAYFYLNCNRAPAVPAGEKPLEGHSNLYVMKFENHEELPFGYAENEPVNAKAQVEKKGSLKDKTITWSIEFTPWQNPAEKDGVTADTCFELRDTIDTSRHTYVPDSVTIDGQKVAVYESRGGIPSAVPEAYALAETSEDGTKTTLCFGGTKFCTGKATAGAPAKSFKITYDTLMKDELLLPGGSGSGKVTNEAELFAEKGGKFVSLNIKGQCSVEIPRPVWLKKEGKTTRHTDGTGSVTDWTVTFEPNGFTFTKENQLTLHDQLPEGSTLVKGSVKVNEKGTEAVTGEGVSFSVSLDGTSGAPVTIKYQTHVPEEMYDEGISLGDNTAWFTFTYVGKEYKTPAVTSPVGSGDGSGKPGTATLVKAVKPGTHYDPANRTITWTATINPHKVDLRQGTFTDDLSAMGSTCMNVGHKSGMELIKGADDITVMLGETEFSQLSEDEKKLVTVNYENQVISVSVGAVGRRTITLTYTAQVCDPCIFAGNVTNIPFTNTISTTDMIIGSSEQKRSAEGSATEKVNVSVLKKNPPVYDYSTGIMDWFVEVDAAGLPMTDVVLRDMLPEGLSYVAGSFDTDPKIACATASAFGQELSIDLGTVTRKTTLYFKTKVNPEMLGFGGDKPVVVENTIRMNGRADGIKFAEVSHRVEQSFANHGLVKSAKTVDNQQELIRYEVLINPFGLALPEEPAIVDTLDKRLQLDADTLCLYSAKVTGTTGKGGQKPTYTLTEDGRQPRPVSVSAFDLATNSFTVRLPIAAGDRGAYVLTYTADIIQRETGGYSNSVRFDGGAVLLGGSKSNSASVGGGGGGGGGGVAARKATISIVKADFESKKPLAGVTFTLYQWDSASGTRGLPFAQGTTDAKGVLSFRVKPGGVYLLEETKGISGYSSQMGWETLPKDVEPKGGSLLITAGAAKSEQKLELTNKAQPTDNSSGGSGTGGGSGGTGGSGGGGGGTGGAGQPADPVTPEPPGEPEDPDKPDEPGDPDKPDEPEKPDKPEKPEKPDKPEKPEKPDKPEKPEKPDKPKKPDKSKKPEKPGKSKDPNKPGKTNTSDKTGKTEQTGKTGKPGASDQTEGGRAPGLSGVADEQNKQGETGKKAAQGKSGVSDTSGSSNSGQNERALGAPQTGDKTPWQPAAMLLSGGLLAAMAGYQFMRTGKGKKKQEGH